MNNILVILPHNPGDVVMGLHVVTALKSTWPEASIEFVVGEECRDLVEGHPHITRAHTIPAADIRRNWDSGHPAQCIACAGDFIDSLKLQPFDLSVNFFQDPFGALLHGQINSKKKIGYSFEENTHFKVHHRAMEHLFSIPAARHQNPFHTVDIFLRSIGITTVRPPRAHLPPLPSLRTFAAQMNAGTPYLVFHMGSAWKGKRWPLDYWVQLARSLPDASIVFTGAPEERYLWDKFCEKWVEGGSPVPPRLIALVGRTNLLETAAVIHNAAWLVAGDTLATHLGAAMGARTLALFGASNPVETGPYGAGHFVLQSDLEVSEALPLGEEPSRLRRLPPESVARFIKEGATDADLYLWETRWNSSRRMLELRGQNGALHPFQKSAEKMDRIFSGISGGTSPPACDTLSEEVLRSIEICLSDPRREHLLELEHRDRALAEATKNDILWEAYRVSLNGLSLMDLDAYLETRKKRLLQVLEEVQNLTPSVKPTLTSSE